MSHQRELSRGGIRDPVPRCVALANPRPLGHLGSIPSVFIPQSEHSQAVRTLIISSVPIQFNIEIHWQHLLFLITNLPCPFCLSAILILGFWLLFWILFTTPACPLVLMPICLWFLDYCLCFDYSFAFCFGHYESRLSGYNFLSGNKLRSLHLPWSASGSLPERNTPNDASSISLPLSSPPELWEV